MSSVPRRFLYFIRNSDYTRYVFLFLTPMLVRPSDFVRLPHTPPPIYTRLRGLWGTPLLVSGIMAHLSGPGFEWILSKKYDPAMPMHTFFKELHWMQNVGYIVFFICVAVLLYGISAVRWGYHCTTIHVLNRWKPELTKPKPLFFLVNTTGWGFWLSLYLTAFFYMLKWWDEKGRPAFNVDDQPPTQSFGVLLAIILFAGVFHLTTRNSNAGMREIYGGSRALIFCVDLIGIALLILGIFLLDYFTWSN